jgi:hypothetical protein
MTAWASSFRGARQREPGIQLLLKESWIRGSARGGPGMTKSGASLFRKEAPEERGPYPFHRPAARLIFALHE